jgi:hypothetical protein
MHFNNVSEVDKFVVLKEFEGDEKSSNKPSNSSAFDFLVGGTQMTSSGHVDGFSLNLQSGLKTVAKEFQVNISSNLSQFIS